VSVITYGVLVDEALQIAAELAEKGVDVEVVDLRTLRPLDIETILNSVEKTGRVVVAYEGYRTGGVGAEIAATIAARCAPAAQCHSLGSCYGRRRRNPRWDRKGFGLGLSLCSG